MFTLSFSHAHFHTLVWSGLSLFRVYIVCHNWLLGKPSLAKECLLSGIFRITYPRKKTIFCEYDRKITDEYNDGWNYNNDFGNVDDNDGKNYHTKTYKYGEVWVKITFLGTITWWKKGQHPPMPPNAPRCPKVNVPFPMMASHSLCNLYSLYFLSLFSYCGDLNKCW